MDMTNNKQQTAMKLYTEADLKKVISIYSEEYKTSTDEILKELNLTPIELPSATGGLNQNDNDKELFYQKQIMNPYHTGENAYTAYEKGFIEGWYKAKQTYVGDKK